MKREHATISAYLLSFGILFGGGAAEAACSNATLKGDYGATCLGTVNNGGLVDVAIVGKYSFDGNGGGSGTDTASFGGVIFRNRVTALTYTVDAACTGSATMNVTNQAQLNATFNATNMDLVAGSLKGAGKKAPALEIRAIESDPNSTISCTFTRATK